MGRPAKFDHDDAVGTAMEAFWSEGYEACSVKALSERLGITRSSFYNAFGSREALFKEALCRYAGISPDRALNTVADDITVTALITRTLREACRVRANDSTGRGCLAINSVAELCNSDPVLGPFLETLILGSVERLERLLQTGVDRGELSAGTDIRANALALQNLLMGLNVMCKVVRSEDDLWISTQATLLGLGLLDVQETTTKGSATPSSTADPNASP